MPGAEQTISLKFKVDADTGMLTIDKFGGSLKKVEEHAKSMSSALSVLKYDALIRMGEKALDVAKYFDNMARSVASSVNEIEKASKISGLSTEQFQKLQYAAKMSDVSSESLATGMKMLSRSMEEVAQGTGDAGKYFQAMGVSVRDSSGNMKPLDKIMGEIADKFRSWEDGPRKIAIAIALFGRSGQELIPLLNEGASGIQKYSQEFQKMGGVLSEDVIKKGGEAEKIFKQIDERLKASKNNLAPLSLGWATAISGLLDQLDKIKGWANNNPRLAAFIFGGPIALAGVIAGQSASKSNQDEYGMSGTYGTHEAKRKQPPAIQTPEEKANYDRAVQELEKMRTEAGLYSHYGKNIGMAEEPGLTPGIARIPTDVIDGYKAIYDMTGRIVALQAQYRDEIIDINASLKETEATNDAIQAQYSAEFEIQKQLGLMYEVPPALYDKELQLKKINDDLEKQLLLEQQEHDLFETRKRTEGLMYEVPTAEETAAMNKRSLELLAAEKQKEVEVWKSYGDEIASAWSSTIMQMIKGTKTFGDAVKSMAESMLDTFLNAISKMIANWMIFGNMKGTYTSGSGLLGWLGSAVGLAEGGAGWVDSPSLFLAGEKGREFVSVTPEDKMPTGGSGSGGTTNVFIYAMDAQSIDDALRKGSGTIIKLVHENMKEAGSMRTSTRAYG